MAKYIITYKQVVDFENDKEAKLFRDLYEALPKVGDQILHLEEIEAAPFAAPRSTIFKSDLNL